MRGATQQQIEQRDLPESQRCSDGCSATLHETGPRDAGTSARRVIKSDEALGAKLALALSSGEQAASPSCLSDEQILAFVEGRFDKGDVASIDEHLGNCAACGALVVEALHACGLDRLATTSLSARVWSLEVGACVAGRYVIRRSIGQGGMGDVFEAIDRERQCAVAIKTPRATDCDNPDATRRLVTEATLAGRVRHPNVCRIHDVGVHRDAHSQGDGLSFLCMDLVAGESLAQHLRRGRLSFERSCVIGREVLAGAAAIHDAGVIHRDIKVQNVMLPEHGDPSAVIIDFGLAIDAARQEARPRALRRSGHRSIEGSPAYMAPEQFWGGPVTPAADVFALGVVLFQAFTGALPFRHGKADRQVTRRDPAEVPRRARSLAPHVPEKLDAFLVRCLDVDPLRRYCCASTALADLEHALRH
jgi:serine/threonine-protein kinase